MSFGLIKPLSMGYHIQGWLCTSGWICQPCTGRRPRGSSPPAPLTSHCSGSGCSCSRTWILRGTEWDDLMGTGILQWIMVSWLENSSTNNLPSDHILDVLCICAAAWCTCTGRYPPGSTLRSQHRQRCSNPRWRREPWPCTIFRRSKESGGIRDRCGLEPSRDSLQFSIQLAIPLPWIG